MQSGTGVLVSYAKMNMDYLSPPHGLIPNTEIFDESVRRNSLQSHHSLISRRTIALAPQDRQV